MSPRTDRSTQYRVATRILRTAAARRRDVGRARTLARAGSPRPRSAGPTREQMTTGPPPAVGGVSDEVATSMPRWAHAPWSSNRRCTQVHPRRWGRYVYLAHLYHRRYTTDALNGLMNRVSTRPSPWPDARDVDAPCVDVEEGCGTAAPHHRTAARRRLRACTEGHTRQTPRCRRYDSVDTNTRCSCSRQREVSRAAPCASTEVDVST